MSARRGWAASTLTPTPNPDPNPNSNPNPSPSPSPSPSPKPHQVGGIQACLASLHAEAHAERVGEAAQRLCMYGDEASLRRAARREGVQLLMERCFGDPSWDDGGDGGGGGGSSSCGGAYMEQGAAQAAAAPAAAPGVAQGAAEAMEVAEIAALVARAVALCRLIITPQAE